jgi:hypothetical protein
MNANQGAVILAALREAGGGWVSALALHETSGSLAVHSRIADLRKQGHAIENRTRREGGRCLSEYRLTASPDPPPRVLERAGAVAANKPAPSRSEQAEFGLPLAPASRRWPD